jgi:hypothetical protein
MSFLLPETVNSLARKVLELGDSEGARRRMERVYGTREVVSLKMCGRGLSVLEGIECERLGVRGVGGSYLTDVRTVEHKRC